MLVTGIGRPACAVRCNAQIVQPAQLPLSSTLPAQPGAAMDLATLALFLPSCFALNMAPGPNNLLSISNATRYGYRTSCLAGVGRLLAFAGMIALASAGLAVVLQTSELLFYGIKILGAAYLIYLAIQLWRANPDADTRAQSAPASLRALARQEFLVAAGNPKA